MNHNTINNNNKYNNSRNSATTLKNNETIIVKRLFVKLLGDSDTIHSHIYIIKRRYTDMCLNRALHIPAHRHIQIHAIS